MSMLYGEREDLGSILMRVIRTLSVSDSGEEREEEKLKLEQQFRQSDSKLDHMVLQRQKELTQVMQRYATVSNRLTTSRTKIRAVKSHLVACKELLHYKRDELKRLWLDGVEHRHVLELLEHIEELKDCPEKIVGLLSQKKYLEATQALTKSLDRLEGDLRGVEGLAEVKDVLLSQKENLYNLFVQDLSKQLFTESTWGIVSGMQHKHEQNPFQRSGSNQGGSKRGGTKLTGSGRKKAEAAADSRPGSGRKSTPGGEHLRVRHLLPKSDPRDRDRDYSTLRTLVQEEEFQNVLQNPKLANPANSAEGRAWHVIVIDIECLALLNQLPNAVEAVKSDLLNELQAIVSRSTQIWQENGAYPSGDPRLLPELFTAVVDQFHLVVEAFRIMLQCIAASVDRNRCADPVKFDIAEVWARVQSVMQMMLTDYLDFKAKNSLHQPSSAEEASSTASASGATTADINSFFVRRKTARPKRDSLFRFEYSSTAMNMKDYLKEQTEDNRSKRSLICSANPHNIIPIYPQLMDFIEAIESALKPDPGTHCTLYAFLMDYIKDVFLGQIHADNGDALNSASLSLDSWKAITDSDVLRDLNVQKPLLQSTVDIKASIDALNNYMRTLPLYSEHFLTMICSMVMQHKEICLAAYRGVVQPESEDKRIISAQWAKDEDIARFLKALPNWQAVQEPSSEVTESPQEVEARNAKETGMLKMNLGGDISAHEILYEGCFNSLAQLQESLDWFAKAILALAAQFTASNAASAASRLPRLSDNSVATLTSLAREFEELADTCLLVLHLEVRVHCFHYLHSIWKGPAGAQFAGGPESTEPIPPVTKLTKDLLLIEDALSNSLQDRKIRYIFEGVSHLVAAIFIGAAAHIRKINEHGVKKMCRNIFAVQHTLTSNITGSRENALDAAKQYYELCNTRPQEILNGIVEKGPMFSQEEYGNIIKLLHKSDATSTTSKMNTHLDKLAEIMKKVGVAV